MGYEMSFETMVLTVTMQPTHTAFLEATKLKKMLFFDLGCMVNGYASDMTRTVAVGKPMISKEITT
ncbi:MAG: M24 family metallopeptidase [Streptococcus salivarius]